MNRIKYVEAMIQPVESMRGNDLPDTDNLAERIADMSSPFVPVGSNEDIDTLMRREGFLSADIVAIVKLSDLEMLIAFYENYSAPSQRSVA